MDLSVPIGVHEVSRGYIKEGVVVDGSLSAMTSFATSSSRASTHCLTSFTTPRFTTSRGLLAVLSADLLRLCAAL